MLADDAGERHRAEIAPLLRDGSKLLLSDSERHRDAAVSALGQLRGGHAVQLVLSELGHLMTHAGAKFDSAFAAAETKNPNSKVHMWTKVAGRKLPGLPKCKSTKLAD